MHLELLTGVLLLLLEEFIDLLANISLRNLHVILGLTIVGHEGKETIIRNIELETGSAIGSASLSVTPGLPHKLVFLAGDIGDIHVMGGGAKIFKFLAGEDINRDKMDFGMSVLAGLGSAHFDNLARAVLDADETVLTERRALHGIGEGGASISALEGVFMLRQCSE